MILRLWMFLFLMILGPLVAGEDLVPGPVTAELRAAFKLGEFYQQAILLEGFPVLGSNQVTPAALTEVAHTVRSMLEGRADILRQLAANKIRLTVMAYDERTCQVPEHQDLQPQDYWNIRARGLGATRDRPCVSCAEENVLNLRGDPYNGESILIHEFAHAIDLMALRHLDANFQVALERAFDSAKQAGKWKNTYALSNAQEYWAEGVQSWFDGNLENDHQHNFVNTRQELQAYDPELAALCQQVFGSNSWRYVRSDSPRRSQTHLQGLNRLELPTFEWSAAERAEIIKAGRKP